MKKRLLRHVHHRLLIFKSLFDRILLLLVFSLSWLSHRWCPPVCGSLASPEKNHLGNRHSQEPFFFFLFFFVLGKPMFVHVRFFFSNLKDLPNKFQLKFPAARQVRWKSYRSFGRWGSLPAKLPMFHAGFLSSTVSYVYITI